MSIRQFKYVPCATCGTDTLHLAMKCRECGTVAKTGYEVYMGTRSRLYAQGKSHLLNRARALHTYELRRRRAALPAGAVK